MTENEMCFPETWEEFRKQYRIVDIEKVYTNGIEMIPTFRVKQWLDHMESVKHSQQSEQNKMAQVATVNNFDKLIGKNGELAELRKEQVLAGAIGIIRRQYAGRSKMEAIAALFGKKLGEEFAVKNQRSIYYHLAFTDKGLTVFGINKDTTLRQLLSGKAEIMEDER